MSSSINDLGSDNDDPVRTISNKPLRIFPAVYLKDLAEAHWSDPDALRQIETALAEKSTPTAVRLEIRLRDRISELEHARVSERAGAISQQEPPATLISPAEKRSTEGTKQAAPVHTDNFWYVQREGESEGPYQFIEVVQLVATHRLAPNTLVWRAGWFEWKQAREVSGLFSPPRPDMSPALDKSSVHKEDWSYRSEPTESQLVSSQSCDSGSAVPPPSISTSTWTPPSQTRSSVAQPSPPSGGTWMSRHWRGELSLARSYWFVGVGITVLMSLGFNLIALLKDQGLTAAAAFAALYVTVWQSVGIWRSAGNHIRKGGNWLWAYAARLQVILGALFITATAIFIAGMLLKPN
ncbi:DUF4339 domain-containing protein [Microvirga sp. BT689]|uniref:DUF4339 domain-containing protein n=1 Tax=Microvirga arvi TaxID=2778731 RepID=UPI0019519EA7|nr:DUF4339 domain-containing protein [Microvirga arvi]MBM6582975.1 DUF4339 domain-containing protein [Microvirga arvi]